MGTIALGLEQVLQFLLKAGLSFLMLLLILLPFFVLAMLLQLVTSRLRRRWFELLGRRSWICLALPGTVVHELGHWIFCKLFRHRVSKVCLFAPDKAGNLGCVNHSWDSRSFYQCAGNFFIGIGPILSGTSVIWLLTAWLMPELRECVHDRHVFNLADLGASVLILPLEMLRIVLTPGHWLRWQNWLWLFSVLLIGSHITLSHSDLQGVGSGAGTLALFLFLGCLLLLWSDPARLLLRYAGSGLAVLFGVLLFLLCFFSVSLIFAELLRRLSQSGE